MHVVRDFYKRNGQVQQSDTVSETITRTNENRAEKLAARREAMAGIMVSGGLCKARK